MTDLDHSLHDEELEFLLTDRDTQGNDDKKPEGSGLKPTMSGDLSQVNLADIFQSLVMSQMEGTLQISSKWEVIYVHHNNRSLSILLPQDAWMKRLGYRLLATGLMEAKGLKTAFRRSVKENVDIGQILAETGQMDQDQFDAIRRSLEEDALHELFTLKKGTFSFYSDSYPDPTLEARFASCAGFEASQVLLEVARRWDEWKVIHEEIGDLNEVFMPTESALEMSHKLGEVEAKLLESFEGTRTLSDIAGGMLHCLFDVAKATSLLHKSGLIERVSASHLLGLAAADIQAENQKRARYYLYLVRIFRKDLDREEMEALAKLLQKAGEPREAAQALAEFAESIVDDLEERQDVLKRARKLDSRNYEVLANLIQIEMAFSPDDPGPYYRQLSIDLAELYEHRGAIEQGLRVLESLESMGYSDLTLVSFKSKLLGRLDRKDEAFESLMTLATQFRKEKRQQELTQTLQQALRISPNDQKIRSELNNLRARVSRKVKILGIVAFVLLSCGGGGWYFFEIKVKQDAAMAMVAEAEKLLENGKFNLAQRVANDILNQMPDSAPALAALGIINRVKINLAREKSARARKAAEKIRLVMAEAADNFEKERYKTAIEQFNAILERHGSDAKVRKRVVDSIHTRFQHLVEQLREELLALHNNSFPNPAHAVLEKDLLQMLNELEKVFPMKKALQLTILAEHLKVDERLLSMKVMPRSLIQDIESYAAAAQEATRLRQKLRNKMAANAAKGSLNELFLAAKNAVKDHDYAKAHQLYEKLAEQYKQGRKPDSELIQVFEDERDKYRLITSHLEALEKATKQGDYRAAEEIYFILKQHFPQISWDKLIKLPIRIITDPPGATLMRGNEVVGKTPFTFHFHPKAKMDFKVALEGFKKVIFGERPAPDGSYYALLDMKEVWRKSLGGALTHRPLIDEDSHTIILTDRSANVWGINAKTGENRFSKKFKELSGDLGSPMRAGKNFILASRDGTVRCLSLSSGKEVWSRATRAKTPLLSPALKVKKSAVVLDERGYLYRFSLKTGAMERSSSPLGREFKVAPVVDAKGTVYLIETSGKVMAVMGFASPTWTSQIRGSGWLSPAIHAGRLYVASDNRKLYALDLNSGKKLWEAEVMDSLRIQPFFHEDHAVICSRTKELIEIDLKNGKILRRMGLPDEPSGPVSFVGKYLALPIKNGGAILLDHDSWSPHCNIAGINTSELALFEGGGNKFFFAGWKGKLFAYPLDMVR